MIYYRIVKTDFDWALTRITWTKSYKTYRIFINNKPFDIRKNYFDIWLKENSSHKVTIFFIKKIFLWNRYYSETIKINIGNLSKPVPPQELRFLIKEFSMKVAKVKLFWNVSPSPDVVSQQLKVSGVPEPITLEAFVNEFVVNVPESTSVHVELTASDGTNVSEPVVLDFTIGDLTKPEPPTYLSYEIVEVVDTPVEPVV
jgi:hypothetical protein